MVKQEAGLNLDVDLCLLRYLSGLLDVDAGPDLNFEAVRSDFWPDLTKIASEQLVLTIIAGAVGRLTDLPANAGEALSFFRHIETTNMKRNRWLLQQLDVVSSALSDAGISAIAMKGGAFLLEDREQAAAWRFFGDLDFLVSQNQLLDAVAVLKTLGYVEGGLVYHPTFHRHYPFLKHPSGRTGIDLHTRAAGLDQTMLLDPDHFFAESTAISSGGADISIPGSTDRLAQLVVNAQILDYRYQRRLFRLRDVLDFSRLITRSDVDIAEIRDRFETYGAVKPLLAYLAMMGDILGPRYQPPEDSASEMQWVAEVRRVIQKPGRAKAFLLRHWAKMLVAQLVDPRQRQHLLERLLDPAQRQEFISRRMSYWRTFRR